LASFLTPLIELVVVHFVYLPLASWHLPLASLVIGAAVAVAAGAGAAADSASDNAAIAAIERR
jgi:uncharacterized membrane protein YraQ (UPF0718 family)